MNHAIDLIPIAYRRQLGVDCLRARYLKIALGVAIACGGLYFHAKKGIGARQSTANVLTDQVSELESIRAQAESYGSIGDDLQSRLNDYNSLAIPIQSSDVVALLGECIQSQVILTDLKLHVMSRRSAKSAMERLRSQASRDTRGKNVPAKVDRILTVEITGLAKEGVQVAQLIGYLEDNSAFQSVQLEFDRIKKVEDILMREFSMSLELDLEAEFVINRTQSKIPKRVVMVPVEPELPDDDEDAQP